MNLLFPNGWIHYLLGGISIGLGVSLIYLFNGVTAGISTFFSSTISFFSKRFFFKQAIFKDTRLWRLFYSFGLIVGSGIWFLFFGAAEQMHTNVSPLKLLLGGVLVGFGSRLSNGCTSGHGICGISSLSLASFMAVIIFMITAVVTDNLSL